MTELHGPPPRADDGLIGSIATDTEEQQPYRSEEEDLWLAVIMNEIHTAFFASDFFILNSEGKGCNVDVVRGDSRRFLCMSWGPWCESREIIAAAAGVDAEILARACRKKLAAVKSGERIAALDEAFASLVAEADTIAPEALDRALADLVALESEAA